MLPALSACKTPATPPIADSACVAFGRISYAIPPVQADGTRNLSDDAYNRYDTLATVKEVAEHNVRFAAVCPGR